MKRSVLATRLIAAKQPVVPVVDRLTAKRIAVAEGCSVRTARRLMASGVMGQVRGRNARDRWVARDGYEHWLTTI